MSVAAALTVEGDEMILTINEYNTDISENINTMKENNTKTSEKIIVMRENNTECRENNTKVNAKVSWSVIYAAFIGGAKIRTRIFGDKVLTFAYGQIISF